MKSAVCVRLGLCKAAHSTVCFYSSSRLAPCVGSPVTHVTCQSSVPEPALTARPMFTYMMDTPATKLRATATTVSVRLTSSNASPCGDQVNQQLLRGLSARVFLMCIYFDDCVSSVCADVQEPSLPLGSASRESTLQVILMGIVGRTPKAPLPSVTQGETAAAMMLWRFGEITAQSTTNYLQVAKLAVVVRL